MKSDQNKTSTDQLYTHCTVGPPDGGTWCPLQEKYISVSNNNIQVSVFVLQTCTVCMSINMTLSKYKIRQHED